MSDSLSRTVPVHPAAGGGRQLHLIRVGGISPWSEPISAQALLVQNAELRAQNKALLRALDARPELVARLERSPSDRDLPDDIHILPPSHLTARAAAADMRGRLTLRQGQVLALVLAGAPSKNIAADLGISQRTVENHRATIMRRTGATSIPALARLMIGAAQIGDCRGTRAEVSFAPVCMPRGALSVTRKAPHAPE